MDLPSDVNTIDTKGDIETGDAAAELRKKIQQDSNAIKLSFIRRLKTLQNSKKDDAYENIIKDEPGNLETKGLMNTKKDAPLTLKRSNTMFGQIIKFIENLPEWLKYVIAGLAWIMYPLYRHLRKKEDEVQESVQSLLQVVERVAEVTEKLASDIAEALPADHYLKGAAQTVSQIAQKVDKDAETAQAFVKMVDDLGDDIDEYLNPLIQLGDAFVKDKKTKMENQDQPELSLDAKL